MSDPIKIGRYVVPHWLPSWMHTYVEIGADLERLTAENERLTLEQANGAAEDAADFNEVIRQRDEARVETKATARVAARQRQRAKDAEREKDEARAERDTALADNERLTTAEAEAVAVVLGLEGTVERLTRERKELVEAFDGQLMGDTLTEHEQLIQAAEEYVEICYAIPEDVGMCDDLVTTVKSLAKGHTEWVEADQKEYDAEKERDALTAEVERLSTAPPECIHCGDGDVSLDHWERCEGHPARVEVERLRDSAAMACQEPNDHCQCPGCAVAAEYHAEPDAKPDTGDSDGN